MAIVDGVFHELEPRQTRRDFERLHAELQDAERAMANVSKAIALGGPIETARR